MFNELVNRNYWCYILEEGGTGIVKAGIVKAESYEEAERKVREAYTKHSNDPFTEKIEIYKIYQKPYDDVPDVLELYEW